MLWSAPWIEALRVRPALAVMVAAVLFALLWTLVPLLFFYSPPALLLEHVVYAREWRAGADAGGPLAAWLVGVAFTAGGMTAVYLLFAGRLDRMRSGLPLTLPGVCLGARLARLRHCCSSPCWPWAAPRRPSRRTG